VIGKRLVKERPVPMAEVLRILEEEKKKRELEYGQRLTYDYTQKFAKLDARRAEELKLELLKIEKVREHQAVALVDLMPGTKEDVELIFSKERTRLEEDEIKRILEIIDKYRE
jgi:DNA-directed RNA polymerase subunit F